MESPDKPEQVSPPTPDKHFPAAPDLNSLPKSSKHLSPKYRFPRSQMSPRMRLKELPQKPNHPKESNLDNIDKALNFKPDTTAQDFIGDAVVNDTGRRIKSLPPELAANGMLSQMAILSLHKAGMSLEMISSQTGIAVSSVQEIINNPRLNFLHSNRIDTYRKSLPVLLMELATTAVTSITHEELQRLNPLQRVTLAAIAIDKARLLLGESTENISVREYVPKLMDEVKDLMSQRENIVKLIQSRFGNESALHIGTIAPGLKRLNDESGKNEQPNEGIEGGKPHRSETEEPKRSDITHNPDNPVNSEPLETVDNQ